MLKRSFRISALSFAGGALLLGGASLSAGAMTLPPPGAVTEQPTAAIFARGADAAKVEQIYWRGRGWHGGWRGRGWHRGWGWRGRGYGWHRGYGWRGGRWCYWHPYACRGY
ncbi:MAG: hypothetical protein ACREDD_03925 [Methylocella sp.]